MKVGLNHPIMREVLEKIVNSMESDVLASQLQNTVPMISRAQRDYLLDEPKKG